jgi:hypothetical protein
MKKSMKVLVAAVALLLLASAVSAQQTISAEKRALIKELLEATGEPKTSEDMVAAVMKQYEQEIPKVVTDMVMEDKQLNAAEKERVLAEVNKDSPRIAKRYIELFMRRMDVPGYIEAVVYPLYDKYFTENEIRDLTTFYRTETGKKAISVMPSLYAETTAKSMEYFKPMMKTIREDLDKEIEQYVKEKKGGTARKRTK